MSAIATVTETLPALKLRHESNGDGDQNEQYPYTHLLPTFDSVHYPPLTPFRHEDPGHRALSHADPLTFLQSASGVQEMTPVFGTEVEGINLSRLTPSERDQLALFVARRGLVVFRGQSEFINSGTDAYLEWGRYFGRPHIHPTSAHPPGVPEIHLVYRDGNSTFNFELDDRITTTSWHTDVSYELQPPGLTTFFLLSAPDSGGDTLFASMVNVLKYLSPQFVAFLRTLKAIHSGMDQAEFSRQGKRGGTVRREPVDHVHPIIRRHPVTGEEALYINRQFTRRIVGLKQEESDNILNFLYDHIAKNGDSQARVRWAPNTIAVWDNRITAHSAVVDYKESKERRHGARITPQAERPIAANPDLVLDE